MYELHDFVGFTAQPGALLRDHIEPRRARRLSAPLSPDAPCAWLDVRANNLGFFSPYDYPCNDLDDGESRFVVGVFGGSVAHWFALQAGPAIARALSASAVTDDRPALVLNCAIGGMKQPQSLLCLNWLLSGGQRFDAVVLIDGFNEAALSSVNVSEGVGATEPSVQHLRELGRAGRPGAGGPQADAADVATRIAEHWARCARLFHTTCRAAGIASVQLVQPNQYFSGKRMSARERLVAVSRTTPYRAAVEQIYPMIVERATRLADDGLPVFSAVDAFDELTSTVYSDNCCHYNVRGNLALADLVAPLLGAERVQTAGRRSDAPLLDGPGAAVGPDAVDDDGDDLYPMW